MAQSESRRREASANCNIYMYRPPSSTHKIFCESLRCMLELAIGEKKEVIVLGDFNCNIKATQSANTIPLMTSTTELNLIPR